MMTRLLYSILRSRSLSAVLVAALVLAGLWMAVTNSLESRVSAELERVSQAGGRLRLTQFNSPKVPEQENAAPFYLAAVNLMGAVRDIGWHGDLESSLEAERQRVPALHEEMRPALQMLAYGHARAACAFKYKFERGFQMSVPDYTGMQKLARLSSLKALVDLQEGRLREGLEESAHLLRFLNRFQFGDTLIQEIVVLSAEQAALAPLEWLARHRVRADYGPVLAELEATRQRQSGAMLRAVEGERALAVDFFEQMLGDSGVYRLEFVGLPAGERSLSRDLYLLGGRPLMLADEMHLLDFYARLEEALRSNPDQIPAELDGSEIPSYFLISRTIVPNGSRAYQRLREFQGRLDRLIADLQALR